MLEIKQVILVNENDEQVGTMEKMEAHRKGLLHRAFSVFIFNSLGEMLLQQRALHKYHSGGLWSNACCSHPMPGEETGASARKRLMEELGFETSIHEIFDFVYKASFANGLTEYEYDHVYVGVYDGPVLFQTDEVMHVRFSSMEEIRQSIKKEAALYTEWFHLAFPKIDKWWKDEHPAGAGRKIKSH